METNNKERESLKKNMSEKDEKHLQELDKINKIAKALEEELMEKANKIKENESKLNLMEVEKKR